jgi:hypothetical protein
MVYPWGVDFEGCCRLSPSGSTVMRTKVEQVKPQSSAVLLTFSNGRLNFDRSFETTKRPSSPHYKAPAFLDPPTNRRRGFL